MKNAIPEIKVRADYITESNNNDGDGKVLKRIIRMQEEKMNIGIDMDNTICSTSEKILEYQEKFIKQEKISSDTLWKNNWYKTKFLNIYLEKIYNEAKIKENVSKVINDLKKQKNKIYIITARTENYVSDIYKITNDYLIKNKIKADGIFINGKDKVEICINNNIDIMIEDSHYNYDRLIDNKIRTILFDEHNKNTDVIDRVLNWNDISNKINEMK